MSNNTEGYLDIITVYPPEYLKRGGEYPPVYSVKPRIGEEYIRCRVYVPKGIDIDEKLFRRSNLYPSVR